MARSKFEVEIIKKLGKEFRYEPFSVKYTSECEYIPDLVPKSNENMLIEIKGRFRTRAEARKYVDIRASNPDVEIIFVFMKPECPMPGARRRRNGTKYTMQEWADKNGFRWFTTKNVKEIKDLL